MQPSTDTPPDAGGRPAIILVSGGLDSATVLAIARHQGYTPYALSFDYGQRHRLELEASRRVSQANQVARHAIMSFDLRQFGGSALTDDIAVPKHRDMARIGEADVIPVTYVPARNTIFLSFALAFAEVTGARDLFIGVNALDYSGYPDCRPEFIKAFETLASLATKAGVESKADERLTIHAPLMRMTKAEIIRQGVALGVDYAMTLSCYDPLPPNLACGACDSCLLRRKGFEEAGVPDPTAYADPVKP